MAKQTADRDALNDFAPKFAHLNDDALFGEVWSRENKLPLKTYSIVTITALISKGIVDSSLTYHLSTVRKNEGWYQGDGKPAQSLKSGDVVTILFGVKRWQGAKADCWFSHLVVECPGEDASNEWLESVTDEAYRKLYLN